MTKRRPIECQWWPVFTVSRPGLSVALHVDRDRHRIRFTATGTKSQTALPTVKIITRGVSARELAQIVGTGARLSTQFQRIMCGLIDPPKR